jgi:transposase
VAQATNAPIATEALRRIAELYAIESEVRGQTPAHRLPARRSRLKPIVEAMRLWFEAQLRLLSGRSTRRVSVLAATQPFDPLRQTCPSSLDDQKFATTHLC